MAFYRRIFQRIALPPDLIEVVEHRNMRVLSGLDPA